MEPRLVLGVLAGLAAVAVFVGALRYKARFDAAKSPLRPADDSDILQFDIEPKGAIDTTRQVWTARYRTPSDVTEFEIELQIAEPVAPSPFAQGAVIFRRRAGSTPGILLRDLARSLGLRATPAAGSPVDELRCDMSFMGSHLTRGAGPDMVAGSFTSSPPGDWIVGKVFFADGEGEVFLAVNPVSRRGELLAKDPEFSEAVVREFGRVL
jgi:hypothetical protein